MPGTNGKANPDEAALLERARAGDVEALADLCETCRLGVCSYLAGAGLAGPDEAEDVFMDAFLRARRAIASFHGGASFSTWITSIARNLALDRRRAEAARPAVALEGAAGDDALSAETGLAPDAAFPSPSAAPVPGEELDERMRNALVRRALMELPGKTREALVLFHLQERSYSEIAETLGVPVGTVMSRLHNGRKALARRLAPVLADYRG